MTDDEWLALGKVVDETWIRADLFATVESRLQHVAKLDALMARWTSLRDPYALMSALQERGIPAGVCQTAADRRYGCFGAST